VLLVLVIILAIWAINELLLPPLPLIDAPPSLIKP